MDLDDCLPNLDEKYPKAYALCLLQEYATDLTFDAMEEINRTTPLSERVDRPWYEMTRNVNEIAQELAWKGHIGMYMFIWCTAVRLQ